MIRTLPTIRGARALGLALLPAGVALLVACSGAPAASTPAARPSSTTPAATASAAASITAVAAASTTGTATPGASTTPRPSATSTAPAATPPAATPAAATAAPTSAPVVATQPPAPAAPRVTRVDVAISNFAYGAASGAAPLVVRWTNNDVVDHDVVGTDGTTSPLLPPGSGAYERRFDRPGTFSYTCSIHPFMTGTVTVR